MYIYTWTAKIKITTLLVSSVSGNCDLIGHVDYDCMVKYLIIIQ